MFFDHLASIIQKQKSVFLLAVLIIGAGVIIGATDTELGLSTLENVEQQLQDMDPLNFPLVFNVIVTNNIGIAVEAWVTGFFVVPTLVLGVESIGVPFGIYLNPAIIDPELTFITFSSFGLLELIAMVFAVAAGLTIPKIYLQLIRERKLKGLTEALRDGVVLVAYSTITLIISGLLEAFLILTASIDPSLSFAVLILGALGTLIYFRSFFRAIKSATTSKDKVEKTFVF